MDYAVVCTAALLASALTLFSGFGLGTLLMPVFALFFPVEVAVAATAVVHLANNLFKLVLVGRAADRGVLVRFAIPAIAAAILGAWLLAALAHGATLHTYSIGAREHSVTVVKLVIGAAVLLFAVIELLPGFDHWSVPARWLPVGGAISGFFGGLSGHQGALRSAFLIRCGLSKEAFIATGVVCAVLVDLSRLAVYGAQTHREHIQRLADRWPLVAAACLAAFVGAFAGTRLVRKVTLRGVRLTVGVMLILMAFALGAGLI